MGRLPGREEMPVQAHQRPVADRRQSADDARTGESSHEQHDDGEARQRLGREDPSRRPHGDQQMSPRPESVLLGKDVAGDQRRQQRQHPGAGERQHHQRSRPAGLTHPAAEDGVGRKRALPADDCHQQRRAKPARQQREADRPPGKELDQLELVAAANGCRPRVGVRQRDGRGGHRLAPSLDMFAAAVRARKAASSGGTTGDNSRTATPPPTRRATRSSRAGSDARTRSAPASRRW